MRTAPLARLLLVALSLTTTGSLRADEGLLRNESRVPTDDRATAAFAQADAAYAAANSAANGAELGPIFESWMRAFAGADRTRSLPIAARPGHESSPDRLHEGPEAALQRRIAWLSREEREAWRAHTATLGERLLDEAGANPVKLAALERELPGTRGAVMAGLRLCDVALAGGDVVAAGGWLRRVAEGLERAGPTGDADLRGAIERRRAALTALESLPPDFGPALLAAGGLEPAGAVRLEDVAAPAPRVFGLSAGTGLFPGLAILDDGRWCVQTASRLHVVVPAESLVTERFEPALLVEPFIGAPPLPHPTFSAPGWWLQPATDGRDLLLVEGRGRSGSTTSNTLLRLTPPPAKRPPGVTDDTTLARAVWARSAGGHLQRDGRVATLPELSGAEFQPGPLLIGGTSAVQVRRGSGDIEALIAFVDWRTGDALFERTLVIGREVGPDLGRFSGAGPRGAGSPLSLDGTRVLVTTNLGVVALVDALDGRLLWSLRNQRRDSGAQGDGFSGVRAAWREQDVHVAPADSDFMYRLPRGPFDGAAPEPSSASEPLARGEHLFLVGALRGAGAREESLDGSFEERLVTAVRSGPRQALALLDPTSSSSVPGVFLPLGEALCEGAFISRSGAVVVAAGERHVYLFDGARELYLLDERTLHDPWSPRPRGRSPALGGAVHIAGGLVGVLSSDALVFLRPRRTNGR